MNEHQRAYIWVAMNKVDFYNKHGKVSLFNQTDIERVKKVRAEIGMPVKVCSTCLDEVVKFMQETYEIYKK